MIKVKSIEETNTITKEVGVSLFADTKSEVTSSAEVKGIPQGYTIAQGSNVITATGDVAFMKSDGTWNWV